MASSAPSNSEGGYVPSNASLPQKWRAAGLYISEAFRLAKPYWQAPDTWKVAWVLLIALIAIEVTQSVTRGAMTYATAELIDTITTLQFDKVWGVLGYWGFLGASFTLLMLVQLHVQYHLIIGWRESMTNRFLGRYLPAGIFHQMELKDYDVDNPDQRIAMDTHNVAEETLTWMVQLVTILANFIVFGYVLWDVSGDLSLPIGGVSIPGYMFWLAIFISVFTIWGAHLFGRPLAYLNRERQKREADFRFKLVRLRENTESVALLKGQDSEGRSLKDRFALIKRNWLNILNYRLRLKAFTELTGEVSNVIPYAASIPAVAAGKIGAGGIVQLSQAYMRVVGTLSVVAYAYDELARWKSSIDRLLTLEDAITNAQSDKKRSKVDYRIGDDDTLYVNGLQLDLPTGEILLNDVSFNLKSGENIVITGASGSGKSTLFRVLSGHWVWGRGDVTLPKKKVMFLPQKPYLPIATLREALVYPNLPGSVSDEELIAAMQTCRLEKFCDLLDEEGDWARTLSGGEQQRLSIVRALIEKPDWLFLDESTAAMDPETEGKIYQALADAIPETTLVSIAHRKSLKKYHQTELRLDPDSKSIVIRPVAASS